MINKTENQYAKIYCLLFSYISFPSFLCSLKLFSTFSKEKCSTNSWCFCLCSCFSYLSWHTVFPKL